MLAMEYHEQDVAQKEIEWLQTQNLDLKNRLLALSSEITQVHVVSVYVDATDAKNSYAKKCTRGAGPPPIPPG